MKKIIVVLSIVIVALTYSLYRNNKDLELATSTIKILSDSFTATLGEIETAQSAILELEKEVQWQTDNLNAIKADVINIQKELETNERNLARVEKNAADKQDLARVEKNAADKQDLARVENEIFQPTKIYEKTSKAIVDIYGNKIGSGFLFKEKNLVVTVYHLIDAEPGTAVSITPHDGGTYLWMNGKVKKIKPEWDLALIELPYPLEAEPLTPAREFSTGDYAAVIGNSGGFENSFSAGIISGLNREISILPSIKMVQFDAAIYFGNSGGPLLNEKGEVIGMTVANMGNSFGFAIPISYINKFLEE